jgi:hypothetical protein
MRHLVFIIALFTLCQLYAQPAITLPPTRPITVENLAKELHRQGVDQWIVVLAQGIIESGWEFDSNLFRETNNFIGMRVPGGRPSMRNGEFKGYSTYARWEDCVADIRLWQDHNWRGRSHSGYISMMQLIWAESPLYLSALYAISRRLEKQTALYVESNLDHFNFMVLWAYWNYYQLQNVRTVNPAK